MLHADTRTHLTWLDKSSTAKCNFKHPVVTSLKHRTCNRGVHSRHDLQTFVVKLPDMLNSSSVQCNCDTVLLVDVELPWPSMLATVSTAALVPNAADRQLQAAAWTAWVSAVVAPDTF